MRGYIRHTTRQPAAEQRAKLVQAGCGEIYEEGADGESIAAAVASLRKGDRLVVTTLDRVGSRRQQLDRWLKEIARNGAIILEVDTGRRSDNAADVAGMIMDALRRKGLPTDEASEYGRKGAAGKVSRVDKAAKRAAKWWHDPAKSTEWICEQVGASYGGLSARLGPRKTPPGPKKKQ